MLAVRIAILLGLLVGSCDKDSKFVGLDPSGAESSAGRGEPSLVLKRMTALVPPPPAPAEAPVDSDWGAVEKQLGTELPNDYKQLVQTYGTGGFGEFVWIYNPFSSNEHLHLLKRALA